MKHVFLAIFITLFVCSAQAEDLLAEDDFSFDVADDLEQSRSWLDDTRFTLQQTLTQGKTLQLLRGEARFEYEAAPWEGTYIKIDNRLNYYAHKDRQAKQQGTDYGHNNLKEAWFQFSHQECFGKVGRQTLLWGNVEGTFAVDVLAPFDYTEPLLTDFASIRLSQDLLVAECFWSDSQFQWFFQPRAKLDVVQHRQKGSWKALEDGLNEEWGVRLVKSWEGLDVHWMYARLYGNTPVPVITSLVPLSSELGVSRHDFVGMSVVKAIRRLLLELDLAYKSDQLEAYSGNNESFWDLAAGFEYTTANNHSFNGGLWLFEAQPSAPSESFGRSRAWTAGWSKTYLNDDLTMSFLGTYFSKPEQHSLTLQGQYKWDDFWTFSGAVAYGELSEDNGLSEDGWAVTTQAKWQY